MTYFSKTPGIQCILPNGLLFHDIKGHQANSPTLSITLNSKALTKYVINIYRSHNNIRLDEAINPKIN
jgi:hypothetical protein